jgi:UDP-N-acetylmuramyl pentapeptide synthase
MFKQHSIKNRAQVGPVSATTLDQAVDQAEETYHTFRVKLMSLISTLKTHHEAMQKLSSSQIEVSEKRVIAILP